MFFSKGAPGFRGPIQIARLWGGCPIQRDSSEKIATKHRFIISHLVSIIYASRQRNRKKEAYPFSGFPGKHQQDGQSPLWGLPEPPNPQNSCVVRLR